MNTTRISCLVILFPTITGLCCCDSAQARQPVPIILDTEIGTEIGDAFALGMALSDPKLEVRGVTTVSGNTQDRAWMVCRFLTVIGKKDISVAYGRGEQPKQEIDWQIQYRRHPGVIFNRTSKPLTQPAVEFLCKELKGNPGKITLVATGPLTNIARLINTHPDAKPWIKRIILSAEKSNLQMDIPAAKAVIASGVPLMIVPPEVADNMRLKPKQRRKIFAACTPVSFQIQALYQLWDKEEDPGMTDALAVALAHSDRFCKLERGNVTVDDKGALTFAPGKSNVEIVDSVDGKSFLEWCVRTLSSGQAALPKEPPNPSKLIPNENMPNRVHAIEDYETDIEKRWWMSGKLETRDVPPGSKRACRGVLTQDFDARMGNLKTMYTAVIFNPVPGPPMGKNPRLRFRYWLKGTGTLRVQIYSLSKGYHRCLILKNLPQQQWKWATVDMAQVRRPDGSGGPLSKDERIDDIQFYTDPRAELIIDDIVLYDAPAAGEKIAFPQSLLFTGWFDTGKQGKEWPGDFSIDKDGYFWRAAKSVAGKDGIPEIRLNLRGPRPVGSKMELTFRYFLQGADRMKVKLVNNQTKQNCSIMIKNLEMKQWRRATVDFQASNEKIGKTVDEIVFRLPKNAFLKIDDLLLYAPGE